jgi:hypothetical protein
MENLFHQKLKPTHKTIFKSDVGPQAIAPFSGAICLVCKSHRSSYCCPHCFIPYCGSQCFQNHSTSCVEQFSKERVKSVLNFEGKSSTDENCKCDWSDLEDENFEDLEDESHEDGKLPSARVLAQNMSRHITLTSPWWEKEQRQLSSDQVLPPLNSSIVAAISTISSNSFVVNSVLSLCGSRGWSPQLPLQVLACLLGYCLCTRTFNFDWIDSVEEATVMLLQSTPAFQITFRPDTVAAVVSDWLRAQPVPSNSTPIAGLSGRRKQVKSLLEQDIANILAHPAHIIYCLVEMWLMVTQTIKNCDDVVTAAGSDKEVNSSLDDYSAMVKKFCLSCCHNVMIEELTGSDNISVAEKVGNALSLGFSGKISSRFCKELEKVAKKLFYLICYSISQQENETFSQLRLSCLAYSFECLQ